MFSDMAREQRVGALVFKHAGQEVALAKVHVLRSHKAQKEGGCAKAGVCHARKDGQGVRGAVPSPLHLAPAQTHGRQRGVPSRGRGVHGPRHAGRKGGVLEERQRSRNLLGRGS